MNIGKTLKSLVSSVAPIIGTAIGGPFGGIAGKILGKIVLGDENAPENLIEAEILKTGMTPEILLKLKEAELEFQKSLSNMEIQSLHIAYMDRDSARKREIGIKDWITPSIAITVLAGFFIFSFCLAFGVFTTLDTTIISMLVGYIAGIVTQVISYYFGSSSGSKKKTEVLENLMNSSDNVSADKTEGPTIY
jgi:hypothetical protein